MGLDISKIKLPGMETAYNIKDTVARNAIEELQESVTGAMHYIGTTVTGLSDGAATSTITMVTKEGAATVTYMSPKVFESGSYEDSETNIYRVIQSGDVVIYAGLDGEYGEGDTKGEAPKEFVALVKESGELVWSEFGSTGSLGGLAFKSSAKGENSMSGTAVGQVFHGTKGTVTVSGNTTEVSVDSHTFTPAGTISQGAVTEETPINYTPAGTVSSPTITITPATDQNTWVVASEDQKGSVTSGEAAEWSVKEEAQWAAPSLGDGFYTPGTANVVPSLDYSGKTVGSASGWKAGKMPTFSQGTQASWSASVSDETLSFAWTPNGLDSWTDGEAPELTVTDVNVTEVTNWLPGSAGTPTAIDVTKFVAGSFTPATYNWKSNTPTSVTLPSFTKKEFLTSGTTASAGEINFTGTGAFLKFTGTSDVLTHSVNQGKVTASGEFTPEGTNDASNVSVSGEITVE